MTARRPWLADASDPLAQVLADDPAFMGRDGPVVLSQATALIHWPAIEREAGPVSIVLRRPCAEEEAEWRDDLAILRQLIATSGKPVDLLALNDAAATELSREMGQPVDVIAAPARRYTGDRRLTLTRAEGALVYRRDGAAPLSAYQFSLARLRRRAVIEAEPDEQDLSDIAAFANGAAQAPMPHAAPVVLVVVPNGIGLGHVTRMMAVAQHLRDARDARVVFWSFSRSVGILSRFGFEAVLRQTARHVGAEPDDWLAWETAEFAGALTALQPDLVVQDSSQIEPFVVAAMARAGTGSARLALIRRGMWQPHNLGADAFTSEDLADLVMEPGDLAAAADRGVTRGRQGRRDAFARIAVSAPVTLTRPGDLLDARRARRALGLGRGRHCLVSLGSDALGAGNLFLRHLTDAAEAARVKLVWVRSPLAAPHPEIEANPRILTRSIYPLAPCLAAFDGAVSATGYNSYHELMQLFDRPVLLAPRLEPALDDQGARADYAATQGWATTIPKGQPEHETLAAFMAEIRSGRRVETRPEWRDGAAEIAGALADLIGTGGPPR